MTTELFDSHCHLHDARMAAVRDVAVRRAHAAGLRGLLLAGVDEADWQAQADLVANLPPDLAPTLTVARAYGIHPQVVEDYRDDQLDQMLDVLSRCLKHAHPTLPAPQAVGELGLDALTAQRRDDLPRQERIFRAQLALAREVDLPIVLHILRTHGEALRVLRADGVPSAGGVVHSYSGSADLVRDYVALGLSISFSGAVTLPQAHRLHQAVRVVPDERLLIETDAPDQTPLAHRPAANEPAFLPAVCAAVAALRAVQPERIAQRTAENARRLFRLRKPAPNGPMQLPFSTETGPR